ncbi:NUDIX domain-containing protein [Nocardiopsis composta]|uniref:ADP-ribose pyrophosphatase n=1 Tax=Nocardiopsis composta TaxID=157465 RepID=A0A7W8VH72_9ACTN|nr:NUDIX hydrolase [Nocardiopsis composta]MBB5435880.1 ADP-ribose pyrophosphatase [Nocardiopsis composta]
MTGAQRTGAVSDTPESAEVVERAEPFRGAKTAMRVDRFMLPGEDGPELVAREYMVHPGAVVALALDERDRVLMVHQYRHAVGARLWELPAGVRDEEGEPPLRTAQRELEEETGHRAEHWFELADFYPSAGFSTERIQVFLARGVTEVPQGQLDYRRVHEEADMAVEWIPLDDALDAVLAGRLRNGATVIGVLAAATARRDGYASLRPAG